MQRFWAGCGRAISITNSVNLYCSTQRLPLKRLPALSLLVADYFDGNKSVFSEWNTACRYDFAVYSPNSSQVSQSKRRSDRSQADTNVAVLG